METVVLPAQDHLAQERYRHQSRVMSGMIYPLGGVPRTRRKVRSPQQVFVASLHSETAKVSSNKSNVQVADSARIGLVSPIDMSMGVLRSAPSSTSMSHLPPLSMLKAPQYRLNNTSSSGFMPHESSSQKQQQFASATPLLNGTANGARQILRTRSDGELLQKGQKKGLEGEKLFSDRRKAHDKGSEGSKGPADRKAVEKTLEKYAEKSSDRRKGLDRRTMERKIAPGGNSSHGDKSSNVQKKAGVITILQRPQTKEAAAENIALFTGRPIEVVTNQIVKSDLAVSESLSETRAVGNTVAVDAVKDAEVSSTDGGETENMQSSRGSRTGSPRRERVAKKKPVRDFSGKAAARITEVGHLEPPRSQNAEAYYSEFRRPKAAALPTDVTLLDANCVLDEVVLRTVDAQKSTAEDFYLVTSLNSIQNGEELSNDDEDALTSPPSQRSFNPKASNSNDRSRNVCPKKERVVKKKQSREFSGKVATRTTEAVHLEPRRTQDAKVYGESRRTKAASWATEVTPILYSNLVVKDENEARLQAEGTEESNAEDGSVDSFLQGVEGQYPNNENEEVCTSPLSENSFNPIASKSNNKAISLGGVLHRGSSDSSVGEISHALSDSRNGPVISRSGSFRDVGRSTDNSILDLLFLSSSPPKNSERWAGPAYTNSPPPSTLPLPTFDLQRVKFKDMTFPEVLRELSGTVYTSSPASPTHMETLFSSATDMQQSPFVDPLSATKDLRRILNLDIESGFRRPEWPEADESATQSLKKMLQLVD